MRGRSRTSKLCHLIVLLIERPRTVWQLAEEIGSRDTTVRRWLSDLQRLGAAGPRGHGPRRGVRSRGCVPLLWRWLMNQPGEGQHGGSQHEQRGE